MTWREHWIAEGIRGGHSYESVARYRQDLLILAAIHEQLTNPLPVFQQMPAAAD